MRFTLAMAGLEAAIVTLWIASFATAIGTALQKWYVELPVLFLALPIMSTIAAIKIGRVRDDRGFIWHFSLASLLACNFVAFFVYAAVSSGGV